MIVLAATTLATALSRLVEPAAATPQARVIVVQLGQDDGPASHEFASLVQRYGDHASPVILVEEPDPQLSRLAAARRRCTAQVLGVFWLDAHRPDEWRLYALPCATDRPLVREIVVSPGAEQAAIEASWLITSSSATAIAEGHALAMAEANTDAIDDAPAQAVVPSTTVPRPTTPTPPPAKPTRKPWRLRASVAYAGEALARAIPWRSGVWAALAWAPRPRLRIGGWYEFLAAARLDDPPGFAVWRHGMALTVAAVLPATRRLTFELRGGPELELSRWRSQAQGRGPRRFVPRVGGDVTVQIGLARGVALEFGAGLAVALIDVDLVTCAAPASGSAAGCSGPNRRVVADSWRVRPRARAGLGVQF